MTSRTHDLPTQADQRPGASACSRILVAAAARAAMAGQTWARRALGAGPLVGWDLATLTYLAWTWSTVWPLDAEHTARQTVREDPGRATADALLLTAAVVTLLAIGLVLVRAATSSGPAKDRQAGLSLASVVLSWGVVHTVFTLRYARLYYTGTDGGSTSTRTTRRAMATSPTRASPSA